MRCHRAAVLASHSWQSVRARSVWASARPLLTSAVIVVGGLCSALVAASAAELDLLRAKTLPDYGREENDAELHEGLAR